MSNNKTELKQKEPLPGWKIAGVWRPVTKPEDCPADDGHDEPTQYILRGKGDDPRSGWVAVMYRTSEQMWYAASQFEYAEYLDESLADKNHGEIERLKAENSKMRQALEETQAIQSDPKNFYKDPLVMVMEINTIVQTALKTT